MPVAIESIVPSAGNATDRFTVRRGAGPADHTVELITPASAAALLDSTAGPASATDNALARFDGTTGKLIQNGVNLASDAGEITFPAVASPATPAAGSLSLFARNAGGRFVPSFAEPTGFQAMLQPHLARNKLVIWTAPGNNLTDAGFFVATGTGTATAVNVSTTNFRTRMRWREWLVTVAATTAVAGFRQAAAQFTVGGNAANRGGFYFSIIWSPATGVSNGSHRAFWGMQAATGAPTDVEPSTLLNMIGMGWDAADTNIQMMSNDGAGTATKVDLGASFPVPTADRTSVYQVEMYALPGTTQSVGYTVTNLDTNVSASGTITTDLPANTTLLCPNCYMSVGGVSSVVGVGVSVCYIETLY